MPLTDDATVTRCSTRNHWLRSSQRRQILRRSLISVTLLGLTWLGIATVDAFRNRWTFSAAEATAMQSEAGRRIRQPEELTNSAGMRFRLIPAGLFSMGTNGWGWAEYLKDERRRHKVTIPEPFYLGVHEVTQGDGNKS
ncbi:MAG UNVERIFIED_CONTAM: hypothetical protein LVR18_12345 [Planctomycetaceae bacterium]